MTWCGDMLKTFIKRIEKLEGHDGDDGDMERLYK